MPFFSMLVQPASLAIDEFHDDVTYVSRRPLAPFCMAKGGTRTLHSCVWQAIYHECLQFRAHSGPHFLHIQGPTDRRTQGYFTEEKNRRSQELCQSKWAEIPSRCRKRGIISTLINYKTIGLLDPSTSAFVDPSPKLDASEGLNFPPFESVSCWSSSTDPLLDFTFMHLYCYLIESKDKSFDTESLKAFKSLKAYKYFADGFIHNVCMHPVDATDYLYIKSSCYPSQKAAQSYTV